MTLVVLVVVVADVVVGAVVAGAVDVGKGFPELTATAGWGTPTVDEKGGTDNASGIDCSGTGTPPGATAAGFSPQD